MSSLFAQHGGLVAKVHMLEHRVADTVQAMKDAHQFAKAVDVVHGRMSDFLERQNQELVQLRHKIGELREELRLARGTSQRTI